jgi:hypothetical protein
MPSFSRIWSDPGQSSTTYKHLNNVYTKYQQVLDFTMGWIHDQLNKRARELTVRIRTQVIWPTHIPHVNTIYASNMTIQEVLACLLLWSTCLQMIARSQILPVPKLSSPQIEHIPASIKFPKNFHPVGTWKMVFYVRFIWHSKILQTKVLTIYLEELEIQILCNNVKGSRCWHAPAITTMDYRK